MKSNLDHKKINTILSQISHGPLNNMNYARRILKLYQDKSNFLSKYSADKNDGSLFENGIRDLKEINNDYSSCDKLNSRTLMTNHLINDNIKNLVCSKETSCTNNMASTEISTKESSGDICSREQLMILVKKLQNKNKGIVQMKDTIVLRFRLVFSKLKKILYKNIKDAFCEKLSSALNINNLLIEYVKSIPNSKAIINKHKNQTVLISDKHLITNRYDNKNKINTNTNSPNSDLRNDMEEDFSKGELVNKLEEGQLNKFFKKQKSKDGNKSTKENKPFVKEKRI